MLNVIGVCLLAQKCDDVDDASNSLAATDSMAETSKLRKCHQSSINLRDDGGVDKSWGHSKDFQPMPSDGLRHRRFSSGKTYTTNSSAFSQPINKPSEHLADDPDDPDYMQRISEHNRNSGADVEENDMAYSNVKTSSSLPGCGNAHMTSNATSFAECSPSSSSPKSIGGLVEEQLATESSEEKMQTISSNVAADSSRGQEVPASLSDSSEVHTQSYNTRPICRSSAPSKRSIELPSKDGSEKAPVVSAHLNQHGHVPFSTEESVPSPFDYSHHSRPVISSMLAEPLTIHQELPARGGQEEAFDHGLLDIADTRSSSSKDNPISPVGSHNDSRLSEHVIPPLSTVFQELIVKVSREHSLSLPEKLGFSPVFIKEAPASPPDYFVSHSSLNVLSSNPSDPVLYATETFEKLPAEGVKEEALLEPQKSAALQMCSFTSEEIPHSCGVDENRVIITSDDETYPLPSICTSVHINATIVNIDTVSPKLNLPDFPELLGEGVEEIELSKFHVLEENKMPFNSEEEVLVCSLAVNNIEHCLGTSEFSVCCQEIEKMEVAGGVSFIKASPELSLLSSPDLVVEGGEDAREKEFCELNQQEENDILINLDEEALQGPLVVSTTEQSLETSELSLCCQDAKMMEVPGIVNFVTVSPELNYPASPELLAEGDEDSKEDESSDLHLAEQKGLPFNLEKEDFLDPLVVDTAEHSLATSEFLLCSEEVEMTEVNGAIKYGLSESQDKGAFNDRKVVATSSDDDSNTQNLINNSMSVQVTPDVNVTEALQGCQEALPEPLHQSTCHSEGIFLSSSDINNDEVYSSSSNSYFSYANALEGETSFARQGGLSEYEDEMTFAFLDTPILLDEVTSAENWTDNSGSTQCIPDSNGIQSLDDGKQSPSETLQEVTLGLEESLVSPDEGINSVKYSLYSRSSSCVSDVNMTEALRGGTSSEPENDCDFSFDGRNPVMFPNMNSTENCTNNPRSSEFILETNMMETLNVAEEAAAGSLQEVSLNFLGTFVALDVGNGTGQSDKHMDVLSSSFVPTVDAFEALQTGQGFSELQCENDFTFEETKMSSKEINNAENYLTNTIGNLQDGEKTSIVALQTAQHGLSKSRDEDVFTLHGYYMSPEEISYAENYLAADHASDLPNTVESSRSSETAPPESLSQDPVSFEEVLVYPDEGSKSENNLGNEKSSLCSTEVNLVESLGGDEEGAPQQRDETILGFEDIYMAHQEATSGNHFNHLGSQHIPNAINIMAETLQGTERLSSEILHGSIFSIEGTSLSLDGGNSAEYSSNNPRSVIHTSQINTRSLLDLQEASFKPQDEKAMNSVSPYEVDSEETNGSNCTYYVAEANMIGTLQNVKKPPSESQDENYFSGAYIFPDEAENAINRSYYSRSSSSTHDNNWTELLAAGQGGSFEPNDENCSSFQETSTSEKSSISPRSVSYASIKEAVRSSGKGLALPLLKDVDSFHKISAGDESASKSVNENARSSEQIATAQAEVNYAESFPNKSRLSSCAPKANCIEALESINKGFFEPQHQEGPEMDLSLVGMPSFVEESKEAEKDRRNSSTASTHHEISFVEAPQELPTDVGSEKGDCL